jgi:uncharacterized membrane-anchored protein YhcB (DUF1043 family)
VRKEVAIVPERAQESWGYVLAGLVGLVIGGMLIALVMRAVPKMASRMAAGMMQGMADRMQEGGCDPPKL